MLVTNNLKCPQPSEYIFMLPRPKWRGLGVSRLTYIFIKTDFMSIVLVVDKPHYWCYHLFYKEYICLLGAELKINWKMNI